MPSLLVFLLISTDSTPPPRVPSAPNILKSGSFLCIPKVEPLVFNKRLSRPATDALRPINPDNARGFCFTATAGTELVPPYSWSTVSIAASSSIKAVYNPKAFIPHAASLHQGFPHCAMSLTAASRRSMVRIAVPSLGNRLSPPLPVIALVGLYLTNKLIGRGPLTEWLLAKPLPFRDHQVLAQISLGYSCLGGTYQRVTNSFAATWQKPDRSTCMPYPRRQRSS